MAPVTKEYLLLECYFPTIAISLIAIGMWLIYESRPFCVCTNCNSLWIRASANRLK
uniref:Uncharacterized protein n=1 Tax=Anguilla anguilla TaxID=7936 RepID=A0A0E9Q961_ANGAN